MARAAEAVCAECYRRLRRHGVLRTCAGLRSHPSNLIR
ncbi:hypothetical protein YT1_2063 [Rhodococcus ruber]|nr:hypothetical protein YT1_2063 [Rhodococcus ruber]